MLNQFQIDINNFDNPDNAHHGYYRLCCDVVLNITLVMLSVLMFIFNHHDTGMILLCIGGALVYTALAYVLIRVARRFTLDPEVRVSFQYIQEYETTFVNVYWENKQVNT